MHSKLTRRSQRNESTLSQVASVRLVYPRMPESVLSEDVQLEHVATVFAPVQTRPSASIVAVVADAWSDLVGSVRSFQLSDTRTSSSARCTGTSDGMAYVVAIRARLSDPLTCRIACTRSLLHCR